jgi:hypothetical protein
MHSRVGTRYIDHADDQHVWHELSNTPINSLPVSALFMRRSIRALSRYREPHHCRSIFEIAVTLVPFAALWALAWAAVMSCAEDKDKCKGRVSAELRKKAERDEVSSYRLAPGPTGNVHQFGF